MKISDILKRNAFLLIFISAFLIYGLSAGLKLGGQSKTPQYVYLAHSFLQGRLDLGELPASTYDLILFENKWYVIGGITPAILLLPLVAVFGKTFSDILFGVFIGALNVALMYSLLGRFVRKGAIQFWLTVLFAFGTAHGWLAVMGSVWFNAQIVAVFFTILYVRASVEDRPWLAGLWMGLAFLSRPSTLFSAAFYSILVLSKGYDRRDVVKKLAPFGIMLTAGIWVMLAYNQGRFGDPFEFGYRYMTGSNALTRTYAQSGGFSVQYMPCNIYVALFGLPNVEASFLPGVNEVCHYLEPISHDFGKLSKFFNPLGMSMFLATPAFLLVFRSKLKDDFVFPAWVAIMGVLLSIWTYHAPGWVQFGYRFTTDFMVFLFVLLARSIKQAGYLEVLLIGLSVIMGAVGVYLMYYMNFGLVWFEMFWELARKIYHFVL